MAVSQYEDDGILVPSQIAAAFGATLAEIAQVVGVEPEGIRRDPFFRFEDTQRRLRAAVEVISRAEPRFGSMQAAYAWYRSEPLPGFSGQTAMQLILQGRAAAVLDYLAAIDTGVHS